MSNPDPAWSLQLVAPGDVSTLDCSAIVETVGASEAELRRRGRNWAIPLPGQLQSLLAPDLGSRFRDLFCLSHENLFPEDKRFLTADGTLGSLLFGASSGLAPQALATAQKDINLALSTARGRRAGTDSLGIRLDEYAIQRTNHAQVARFNAHEQATAALARARESLDTSNQKMESIAHARRELDRLLNGVRYLRRMAGGRRCISPMGPIGQPPERFTERRVDVAVGPT